MALLSWPYVIVLAYGILAHRLLPAPLLRRANSIDVQALRFGLHLYRLCIVLLIGFGALPLPSAFVMTSPLTGQPGAVIMFTKALHTIAEPYNLRYSLPLHLLVDVPVWYTVYARLVPHAWANALALGLMSALIQIGMKWHSNQAVKKSGEAGKLKQA